MSKLRTVSTIIDDLGIATSRFSPMRAPAYYPPADARSRPRTALAVESMKYHTTDEGWQIMAGLEHAGYRLSGRGLTVNNTDTREILKFLNPSIAVVQDKREWDVSAGNFRDPLARFWNINVLKDREDVFKLTILKDAHQSPAYHMESAEEIGCHAWIIYYNPEIVSKLAPYVRPAHMIRTYHTIDHKLIPPFPEPARRDGCLLSGAISNAYPLRRRLARDVHLLQNTAYLPHPGYHRNGCETPRFLKMLTNYRVAVCTSSVFGYALRKIIEATACGCRVITDLPTDEYLPGIDENLIRVPPNITTPEVRDLINEACSSYDVTLQTMYARAAWNHYDYRAMGRLLASDIEQLRRTYSLNTPPEEEI